MLARRIPYAERSAAPRDRPRRHASPTVCQIGVDDDAGEDADEHEDGLDADEYEDDLDADEIEPDDRDVGGVRATPRRPVRLPTTAANDPRYPLARRQSRS